MKPAMLEQRVELLAANRHFSAMGREAIRHLAETMLPHELQAGDILFREGDPGESLYVIEEGPIEILKDLGWGEHVLTTLGPGDMFGEMSLISFETRTATARAGGPVRCLEMNREIFQHLLDEEPRFSQSILKLLNERLASSDEANVRELLNAHQALIFSLAKLAESRDPDTGGHLNRVRSYCRLMAGLLHDHPDFHERITPQFIESIYICSPLHDIGKVAIPDSILLKKGRLGPQERAIMNTHPAKGAEAIQTVLDFCDHETFRMAHRIVHCHHERWDGKGYPRGLAEEEIPLEARIMMVADVYDALRCERVYKPALPPDETLRIMREMEGSFFDPRLVEVLVANIRHFEAIHERFREEPDPETRTEMNLD